MNSIDWEALARQVGTLTDSGESGGDQHAKRALVNLLGEEAIQGAVAHYVAGRPGSELARSVLSLLQPAWAMTECYRLYRTSGNPAVRSTAVELLRVVANGDALIWIAGFLADDDPCVQTWGIGVLDQLVWRRHINNDDAEPLLVLAAQHPSAAVREQAALIRSVIADRQDANNAEASH